jgi:hypothetical protein
VRPPIAPLEHGPANHVVLTADGFHCKHCAAKYPLQLPLLLSRFLGKSEAFLTLHRDCPDREGPSPVASLLTRGAI